MSDRYVLVRVTNGEKVVVYSEKGMKEREVPVPEDNQLREDLEDAAIALDGKADNADLPRVKRRYQDAARRLRAWAGLDAEDQ